MRLLELNIPDSMNTSEYDITNEFFVPLLTNSAYYNRGVGYFSSGWFRENAQGMSEFAKRGGRARWVTSPIMSKEDWEAILLGDQAKKESSIKIILERNIHELGNKLEANTRKVLAWMVADNIVSIKLAVPRNKLSGGEFHDKFGYFEDSQGNKLSFNGSNNESIQGTRNYESFKIFKSWDSGHAAWVEEDVNRFEKLWKNEDNNVQVFEIDEANRERILKLRENFRPYAAGDKYQDDISLDKGILLKPKIPSYINQLEYQDKAVNSWIASDGRGVFKMATGTGKTITALKGVVKLWKGFYDNKSSLTTIVVCPYQHLVTQWYKNAREFHFIPIKCFESYHKWYKILESAVSAVNILAKKDLFVITTISTFSSKKFQLIIERLNQPLLLVVDEAHNLGSPSSLKYLPEKAQFRLGLSATPERWHDEEGTEELYKYFGKPVFEYGLEEAINNKHLTRYKYYPVIVPLTENELDKYLKLSYEISMMMASGKYDLNDEDNPLFKKLLLRARITANASNKLEYLKKELLKNDLTESTHNLVYCGDGRVDTESQEEELKQIEAVTRLLGNDLGMINTTYIAETKVADRESILKSFSEGRIQALVAIRCLDEGVDVPATKRAFILASSTNPRQFIQRRGRVLRKFPGKEIAEIWDFLVVPPFGAVADKDFNYERKLIEKELTRVIEFAKLAQNGHQANKELLHLKEQYHLLHL